MRGGPKLSQFSGEYLDRQWTRRFILGTLLQRYGTDAPAASAAAAAPPAVGGGGVAVQSAREARLDAALLSAQRVLSAAWALPVRPLDATSEGRILRLLARYACCEGTLPGEALEELRAALARVPGAPAGVARPEQMEVLLQRIGYVVPGDNIRRVAFRGELHYPPQALAAMAPFVGNDRLRRDGGDAFDAIRERRAGPAYAVDSATTSEVDDAIGVETDPATGRERFTVYVSDATVYCPYDSPLEQLTARALGTTTYLPEGVYFMLPKPVVREATLREDRPCRTFNVSFSIDETSGELTDFTVAVGWLQCLRRLTYEQVQRLLVPPAEGAEQEQEAEEEAAARPPGWLTAADAASVRRIYAAAVRRLRARVARREGGGGAGGGAAAAEVNLPDPYIAVEGTRVTAVRDQVVATAEARLAVSELMIAANEACSRVAQAHGVPIPFRGTRARSHDHEAARRYREPPGVLTLPSLDARHTFAAEAMQQAARRLGGVTRAMYTHTPTYHGGLDTCDYCHSTSPLRRYADMLVHHQLKVWLWGRHGRGGGGGGGGLLAEQAIPEYTMATLCAAVSARQEQSSLLQDASQRFWLLTHIAELARRAERAEGRGPAGGLRLTCLVGSTRRVDGAPDYTAHDTPAAAAFALLAGDARAETPSPPPHSRRRHRFVSDVYVPAVQLTHQVMHDCPAAVVGAVVECAVARVLPTQGVLELRLAAVHTADGAGSALQDERLWLSGAVAAADT